MGCRKQGQIIKRGLACQGLTIFFLDGTSLSVNKSDSQPAFTGCRLLFKADYQSAGEINKA